LISSILVYLLIAFESVLFGNMLAFFLQPQHRTKSDLFSLPKSAFGFVAIVTLAAFLSIFIPLNVPAAIAILTIAGLFLFALKPSWSFSAPDKWVLALFILIVLFTLEVSTRRPLNSDTNLYHAQAIRWIETYPAVFGLGNLHGRLAFNSVWFIANASYSFSTLLGRSLHVVSGLYFLFFGAFALSWIKPSKNLKLSIAATFLLLAGFQYLASDISSPGTDVPTALTVWLVFMLTLSEEDQKDPLFTVVIAALSAFAVVIKLSSMMVLLIPAGYFFRSIITKDKRSAFTLAIVTLVILTPFLIRNVIESGYLIYPFPGDAK